MKHKIDCVQYARKESVYIMSIYPFLLPPSLLFYIIMPVHILYLSIVYHILYYMIYGAL